MIYKYVSKMIYKSVSKMISKSVSKNDFQSVSDDPEDRKDGILEVGGEEISADEADPDYTEYMTGGAESVFCLFFLLLQNTHTSMKF